MLALRTLDFADIFVRMLQKIKKVILYLKVVL